MALRDWLLAFEDVALSMQDYALAAQAFNNDFIIRAVSFNHQLPILSLDKDFRVNLPHDRWVNEKVAHSGNCQSTSGTGPAG